MRILILSVCAMLLVSACNFGNVGINRNADGSTDITIALTESDVNNIITNTLAPAQNPLLRDPQVDLQNGQIYITGTHDRRDGGGSVSGNLTVNASVTNGQVSVVATSLNIEGFAADDARLQDFNNQLAAGLGAGGLGANRDAQITSISITDNAFTFTLQLKAK